METGPYDTLINELAIEEYNLYENPFNLKISPVGRRLVALTPNQQIGFVLAAIDWLLNVSPKPTFRGRTAGDMTPSDVVRAAVIATLRRPLPLTHDDLNTVLYWSIRERGVWAVPELIKLIENFLIENKMTFSMSVNIERLLLLIKPYESTQEYRKYRIRLQELSGTTTYRAPMEKGEAWSDAALADLEELSAEQKPHWLKLLNACSKATGSAPTGKWLKQTETLMNDVGFTQFRQAVVKWFPLVDKPRTQRLERWSEYHPDPNQLLATVSGDVLRGLVWLCAQKEDKEIARALTALAVSAYRKVPFLGPRCLRLGNACVWALGAMPGSDGVGQLALLKVKVKNRPAQKGIEKALDTAAKRIGLPRAEIEELAVPTYGLDEVGSSQEQLAGFTAELIVTGTTSVELRWIKPDGKRQSSVPQAVKEQHPEELKELNQAVKDIRKMLPAQATRIENLYLEQKRWPLNTWRERYLDHPLVGTLARRLIWKFTNGDRVASGVWLDDQIAGVDGQTLEGLNEGTEVELWHPLYETSAGIMRWRELLAEHQVQQPFKQAHREIYLLTDAERMTRIYSNRFAAHIIKQHQFNALCGARGWKNRLRMGFDSPYEPASRELPVWKLQSEFWVEGVGGDEKDFTEAGSFLYLSTDQVRFFETNDLGIPDVEPLDLSVVPPLVFSEIMRDVDLFVGVASVANDPAWLDSGPELRYQGYWTSYSFGELSETAKTRQQVLENLIPRLKIADRCRLTDKFLVVRGDVRTYKIHLGSSNILMEPNDQYLCIVASPGQTFRDKVFLPFEGDNTLSLILSKAFLLAEDWKITDPTILRQIGDPDR